ncbi:cysteine hydrolase family protein [uncultured Microbulbifer sp.]|uniref:cysteine hydrolase family protein n=1 Tax=uncultured Microbulbifer sp. TaxID=348147 RepID=UPI002622D50A|nr:cysteine hydrolase family protein [uncultured Microbulbifer sp.]
MFNSVNPILLVVDVQEAIDSYESTERNNPDAEENMSRLIGGWRAKNLPVIHVRHSSKYENSPYHKSSSGFAFKRIVKPAPGESVVTKSENCAFIGTNLESAIRSLGATEIVICGVLINNSIDATIRVAAGLGFSVFLPQDATAAYGMKGLNGKFYPADDVFWLYLSNLAGEYCHVVTTDHALSPSPELKSLT